MLGLENVVVALTNYNLGSLESAVTIECDRIENTRLKNFFFSVLLNGKFCAVRIRDMPVIYGVWYCTSRISAVYVDAKWNPHLDLDSSSTTWHTVDISESELEKVWNSVIECEQGKDKTND